MSVSATFLSLSPLLVLALQVACRAPRACQTASSARPTSPRRAKHVRVSAQNNKRIIYSCECQVNARRHACDVAIIPVRLSMTTDRCAVCCARFTRGVCSTSSRFRVHCASLAPRSLRASLFIHFYSLCFWRRPLVFGAGGRQQAAVHANGEESQLANRSAIHEVGKVKASSCPSRQQHRGRGKVPKNESRNYFASRFIFNSSSLAIETRNRKDICKTDLKAIKEIVLIFTPFFFCACFGAAVIMF